MLHLWLAVNKKYNLLLCSSVIASGVDIPNANTIFIDNAHLFGLSQLHQIRGRVGRGSKQSKCVLIDTAKTPSSRDRLEVLVNSNDGFEISEIDLRLRGPGQVLGTKQSGLPDFGLANFVDDESILDCAREEAAKLLRNDPKLEKNK